MANISIPNVFVDLTTAYANEVNANFDEIRNKFNTYAVQTDVARTITVTHTWTASQTFSGGATFGANIDVTGQVVGTQDVIAGSIYNIGWTARAVINSPADGVIRLWNNSGTTFDRLQFGGSTSSFPALKRGSAELQVRVADDSAYANLDVLALKVAATQVVGARKTGWATATGTATRTTFATSSVTLPQLAERVKALIDDLHGTAGHGLIGT